MRNPTVIAILKKLILSSLLLVACSTVVAEVRVGDRAPDISTYTLDGDPVSLSQALKNGPVYLVFWAIWCPNCLREIPKIKALQQHFKERMTFIGINIGINEEIKQVKSYLKKHNVSYDIVLDKSGEIIRDYGVAATPVQIIVNQQNLIEYRGAATPAINEIEKHWSALIDKK